ncbi:poly-beta-hydroxybutyrate polymerase N-terminal domain-containing protein [Hydrogenophaga sp. BPS33]|uniref:poly-beta-hydroxybutyrate polymerase N-terminal domain-containing protein n=1 Tax=Hydrogenophaga sp. BPS33 TaxID=2651974 RepID=UPI001320217E|nr:poly-beta-hydroxybutyrate polymerase N-terminal domain-containing protein [Hydrogenophaga sp. BPS33]QHE86249.1 hypothetical protein F9K07_15720 [Hydrogenophaga sp. BPS33]
MDVPLKLWIARLASGLSPAALVLAPMDWWLHLLVSPAKQAQLTASGLNKVQAWAFYLWRAAHGPCEDCVTPAPQEKRFSQPEWQQLPFNALAQGFLLQFASARTHAGSWWSHWQGWLATHSSRRVKARPVAGLRLHGRSVPAPGTYVHDRAPAHR